MTASPRALHLNDCAFVGQNLVTAAGRIGMPWRILPPGGTWPRVARGHTQPTRVENYRTLARIAMNVAWSEVVHVHFATTVRRLRPVYIPRRPYVLHLHGTDIRTLWKDPVRGPGIQAAISGARHVFYSTRDNEQNATTARADAEYLPVFVDAAGLPSWHPQGYVAFASRWEDVKGLEDMVEVARGLAAAGIETRGLDWGPGTQDAQDAGVRLVPKMAHEDYLRFLAGASVVVGQASRILSVSELEAMAIGIPLAAVGDHLPGPDGGRLPIRQGSVSDVLDAVVADVADPAAAARDLGSRDWTLAHHTADRYVPRVVEVYRDVVG